MVVVSFSSSSSSLFTHKLFLICSRDGDRRSIKTLSKKSKTFENSVMSAQTRRVIGLEDLEELEKWWYKKVEGIFGEFVVKTK